MLFSRFLVESWMRCIIFSLIALLMSSEMKFLNIPVIVTFCHCHADHDLVSLYLSAFLGLFDLIPVDNRSNIFI